MIIYHLFFEHEHADSDDIELSIGYFSTESEALDAMQSLRDKPGFRDYPEGFTIDPITLGFTGFRDGFEIVFGPPPKDKDGEMFVLPL